MWFVTLYLCMLAGYLVFAGVLQGKYVDQLSCDSIKINTGFMILLSGIVAIIYFELKDKGKMDLVFFFVLVITGAILYTTERYLKRQDFRYIKQKKIAYLVLGITIALYIIDIAVFFVYLIP